MAEASPRFARHPRPDADKPDESSKIIWVYTAMSQNCAGCEPRRARTAALNTAAMELIARTHVNVTERSGGSRAYAVLTEQAVTQYDAGEFLEAYDAAALALDALSAACRGGEVDYSGGTPVTVCGSTHIAEEASS